MEDRGVKWFREEEYPTRPAAAKIIIRLKSAKLRLPRAPLR